MNWFKQVLVQGSIVALLAVIVLYSTWMPLSIFCLVLLLFVIVMVGRNPILFYRRLLRLIVLGALPFLVGGLTVELAGSVQLPQSLGLIKFFIAQGQISSWLILGLAALCILGDALVAFWEHRRRSQLFAGESRVGDMAFEPDGRANIVDWVLVTAPQGGLVIAGAILRINGLFPKSLPCQVHPPGEDERAPQLPIVPVRPLALAEGQSMNLRISASAAPGKFASWLRFRARTPIVNLVPIKAELRLEAAPRRGQEPLPLVLRPIFKAE